MFGADKEQFDKRVLIRLAVWGGAAVFALLVVIIASRTEMGARRIKAAFATMTDTAEAAAPASAPTTGLPPQSQVTQLLARTSDLEYETRRLSDAMRVITADRERLQMRLATVERNLEDMTGSIDRRIANNIAKVTPPATSAPATAPAAPAGLPPVSLPQVSLPHVDAPATKSAEKEKAAQGSAHTEKLPAEKTPASAPAPAAAAAPLIGPSFTTASVTLAPFDLPSSSFGTSRLASESASADDAPEDSLVSRTEFGVDVGGGVNMDVLRALWTSAKAAHGPLFEGLYPIVAVRQRKGGVIGLRLVIGPLANADDAARLCAQLTASGIQCRQTVFDGQKLALR